ncbi:MAG: hypothetical protein HY646_14900 [Acidobacteria bacterium]|nr:hypothetical protein [Acidobacteriota bacterium]
MNRSKGRSLAFAMAALSLLAATAAGFALQTKVESPPENEYVGILLPKLCGARFPELLPHASEHTLTCAVFPQCYESGYGIVMSDKFYPFDEKGDDIARRVVVTLKAQENVQVVVRGVLEGATLKATAISERPAEKKP